MDDFTLYFALAFISILFTILSLRFFSFVKTRREKLYILDLSTEPVKLSSLGFIMNELKPTTRLIKTKRGSLSKTRKYRLTHSIWDLKIDFKSALDTKKHYLIIGRKNPPTKGGVSLIETSLTKNQMDMVIRSEDTLVALNKIIDQTSDTKIREFKQSAQATLQILGNIGKMTNELQESWANAGQGAENWMHIFKRMHKLDDNEINIERGEAILTDIKFQKAKQNIVKMYGNNTPRKRLFLKPRKNGGNGGDD